jgi:WD40 repeat protein
MTETNIFTVGGTVQASNGLYIPRRADNELLKVCRNGNFAYVLTPRQLGKSSLMVRTSEQLTGEGIKSVIIDLTQIGVQVTPEAWYLGLLSMIEEQLELDTNAVSWWQKHSHLGVTQRLTRFFEEVLLEEVQAPVVVFVDEIDTTLSLTFTDDFFAAIRYFYNARAVSQDVRRLSFVLIGVATPGDLIRDPDRTPFNIGQRVNLTDFTLDEALPLADGLGLAKNEARQVLGWVLKWTQGHPYLTQRLCRALTDEGKTNLLEQDVDAIVSQTFFGRISQEDNNLQFVRDMLTKRAPDLSDVLHTYSKILKHKHRVEDEEQSLIKSHLKLSGIVQRKHGELVVRNPIYAHVFNEAWIKQHLPINWTRRLTRVAAGLVLTSLILSAPLGVFAFLSRQEAIKQRDIAKKESQIAEDRRNEAEAQRRLATREWERAETAARAAAEAARSERQAKEQAQASLTEAEEQRKKAENAAKRALLAEQAASDAAKAERDARLEVEKQRVEADRQRQRAVDAMQAAEASAALARSAEVLARNAEKEAQDLRLAAEEKSKSNALERDIAQGQHQMAVARQLTDQAEQRLLSGNGPSAELLLARSLTLDDRAETRSALLEASVKNAREVWSRPTEEIFWLTGEYSGFSPDMRVVALTQSEGAISLIDPTNGHEIRKLIPTDKFLTYFRDVKFFFSSDSRYLAVQSRQTNGVNLWDVGTGNRVSVPPNPNILSAVTSTDLIYQHPDNESSGIEFTFVRVNINSGKETASKTLKLPDEVGVAVISYDPAILAFALPTGVITLLDIETGETLKTLGVPGSKIDDLEFSEDGKKLVATSGNDISLWDLSTGKRIVFVTGARMFKFGQSTFVTMTDYGFKIWDLNSGNEKHDLPSNNLNVSSFRIGTTGDLMAVHDKDNTIRIVDTRTGDWVSLLHTEGLLVGFSFDEKQLYSVDNGKLKAWNLDANQIGKVLFRHNLITSVAFSPDGNTLVSGGADQTIKFWNTGTGQQIRTLPAPQRVRELISFDPERRRLGFFGFLGSSGSQNGNYNLLDTASWNTIATTPAVSSLKVDLPRFQRNLLSPDGRIVITQTDSGVITVLNLENKKEFNVKALARHDVLAFTGDSRQFAQTGVDGTISIWDIETEKVSVSLQVGKSVRALYFAADKQLAVDLGNSVELWDTKAKGMITGLSRITGSISEGLFSPDAQQFAALIDGRRIKLWDVKTGRLNRTLSPGVFMTSILFSPDGKWLISRSADLRLWNLEGMNPATGFILPASGETNAAFDREGRYLAYGGRDNRIRLWNFDAVKRFYLDDHWSLLRAVNARTERRVNGLDFEFLPQIKVREILGNKYNPIYTLSRFGDIRKYDERDKQVEENENSIKNQPTQGGRISGTIRLNGNLPTPKRLDTTADPTCAENLITEDWVGTDGKLANVFIYIKGGSRLDNYGFEASTSEVIMDRKGCRSIPRLVGVQTNQVLTFLNSDNTQHNYHPTPKLNPEWNQTLPQGAPPLYKEFDRPEIIPLKCNQHPWEKSYIGVFPNPFFAVSDKDGSYTIEGLPPGRYTIVAWHEGFGGTEQTIEITIGPSESKTIDFVFNTTK